MHSCLEILEILSQAFSYLKGDPKWPRLKFHKSALASLPRTCRAFHQPAIRELWYYQRSLRPLSQCLPSNAYVIEDEVLVLLSWCLPNSRILLLCSVFENRPLSRRLQTNQALYYPYSCFRRRRKHLWTTPTPSCSTRSAVKKSRQDTCLDECAKIGHLARSI